MAKILICPNKYVQGAGEMSKIADYAKAYGKKALVVITASGYKRIGATVESSHADGQRTARQRDGLQLGATCESEITDAGNSCGNSGGDAHAR